MSTTAGEPDFIPFNFGALEESYSSLENARVVILPVPYDGTASYLSGSRDGPHAIISASRNMELFDDDLGVEPFSVGIHTLPFLDPVTSSPDEMVQTVSGVVSAYLRGGKFVVLLGGDHILSVGPVAAAKLEYDSLGVIQFDAHADLRESYQGSRMSHACTGRRLAEMCPLLQLGTRSMSRAEQEFRSSAGIPFLPPQRTRELSAHLGNLPEKVYVTVDVDVFDPSIMPSVGTPEPGGLSWAEVTGLVEEIAARKEVVGFDVTELRPIPGLVAPDFLAAKLIYRLIGRFVNPSR
ncbi:MAG: agmatinase [Candidatus Eiseniibacteriota bacterium]|nr:MAG: agmatinase [Candidatus Eisenbacteria bacterium]